MHTHSISAPCAPAVCALPDNRKHVARGPACREELLTLLGQLGYRIAPLVIPDDHWGAWALDGEHVAQLTWVGSLSDQRSFQILLAEHPHDGVESDRMAWLNRWAGRLWRLNRTFQGLLICAPVGHWESCLMSMVFSDGHPSRPGLRHLRLSAAPLRMDTVERLKRLAVQRVDGGATQLVRRLADELDLVHVTRSDRKSVV